MSEKGDLKKVFRDLSCKGWHAERTGKSHIKMTHDQVPGEFILLPNKPGPVDSVHWKASDIKRIERKYGL